MNDSFAQLSLQKSHQKPHFLRVHFTIESISDAAGRRINTLQRGVNILRMSDGTTKKVMVK